MAPNDILIRITTAAICGADLHTYRGLFGSKNPPWTMGHEGIGIIVEVGEGVKSLKIGDRVTAPGVISCGYCDNCVRGYLSYCLTFNPPTVIDPPGMGDDFGPNLGGTQAQYVRVPFADLTCLKLSPTTHHNLDYVLITDIFATAWYALDCSGFQPGDTVTVFSAGPVGLLSAYSAILRGATRVYLVNYIPSRLEKATSLDTISVNFIKADPVETILKSKPRGVRRCCDCVGFECVNAKLEPEENTIINNCIKLTEPTGGIGLIGVYPSSQGLTPGTPLASDK